MSEVMKTEGWEVHFEGDLSFSESWHSFETLEEAIECVKNPPLGAVFVNIHSI
jgi:hypothetical protein